ncbi:MAG: TonB-dependent receptor [Proteobacteria bacterium]|nr:TonB-dependent receptor [Pseudomonadota bacterium]
MVRRVLLATTAISGALAPTAVLAQDKPATVEEAQASPSRTVLFNIPAQPLDTAMTRLADQAGIRLLGASSMLAGKQSAGLSGAYTVDQALTTLLAGSGVTWRYSEANTVVLEAPNSGQVAPGVLQLDPVHVRGSAVPPQAMINNLPPAYAGGQVATGSQVGLLGNRDVMDTPFTQTSYTAKRVQDEQARTLRDALADDASVRAVYPSGGSSQDVLFIRGFPVSDVGYGGLYGLLPFWSVSPQIAERVEVLRGPSAFLNGMPPAGSIGGAVNIVPKRAANDPLTEATMSYMSSAQFGGAVDVGRRFGSDKRFGARLNAAYRDGDTPIQFNRESLGLGVLGLDFRGDRFRLSTDLGYQNQHLNGLVPYISIPAGVTVPGAPSGSRNFGQPWTYGQREDVFGVLRGEFDITDRFTVYAAFGAKDNRTTALDTGTTAVSNSNGNFTSTPFAYNGFYTNQSAEAGVRASFDTGVFNHKVNLSASAAWQQNGASTNRGTVFASNIFNPTYFNSPSLGMLAASKTADVALTSLAIADTVSVAGDRIQLTVGGRQQRIALNNYTALTGIWASGYDYSLFSPSVGLVVKPRDNVSVYGNFIQGLQQGTIVTAAYANAGQVLPPYVSTQYELGVKVDWGKVTTTLAAFQITQPNAITNTTSNTLTNNGEQRNRGLELNVFGEIADSVRVLGGMTFFDAVLTRTTGGTNDGWAANGIPPFQANVGLEWDTSFVKGLTLNGRVLYTGAEYVNTGNPRSTIPEWARLDLGARYTFERADGQPITARLNVENVFDTNYYAGAVYGAFLWQGAPRTVLVSLSSKF